MSRAERERVGNVLRLERREVVVDPALEYEEIGVRSFGRGIFHKEPVGGASLGSKRVFRIEPGDLVISNVFAWEGAIAVASGAETGRIGSHRFMTFVPRDSRIDPRWAAWYLLSEPGLELIRKASPGSAGRNKTLAVNRFEDLVIPLPPPEEQRRVAAKLDKIRALTDRVARLVGRSVELGRAFAPALAGASHRSPDDKSREGWEPVRLGEVLSPARDQTLVDVQGSYPNLGIYGFGRGVFAKPPITGDATSARTLSRVRAGQFIYSRLFAFEGAYAEVPDAFDGYFVSNEFPSFDPDRRRLNARWLASYLRSPEQRSALAAKSVGLGVRRQRVPVESVLAHEILLPPIDEQQAMMRHIGGVEQLIASHNDAHAIASALIPSMLNREFGTLA